MEKFNGDLISTKNSVEHNFVFEYQLWYDKASKALVYYFDIWKDGDESKRKFSYLLRVMENGVDLKVIDLYAHDYKGKGISIAIILKSKELFNKRIIFSSNTIKSFSGEENKPIAIEKVWKRMTILGIAAYDNTGDFFYTL